MFARVLHRNIQTNDMIRRDNGSIVLVDFAASVFDVDDEVRWQYSEPSDAGYKFLREISERWAGFGEWAKKPGSIPADLDMPWPPRDDDDEMTSGTEDDDDSDEGSEGEDDESSE